MGALEVSLEEELLARIAGRQGSTCSVNVFLSGLSEHERDEIDRCFRNRRIPTTLIHEEMAKRGFLMSDQPVQRHARRMRTGAGCTCPV